MVVLGNPITRWRYRSLLALLIATMLIQPLMHEGPLGRALMTLTFGVILFGGLQATRPSRSVSMICLALTVALVGLSWMSIFSGIGKLGGAFILVTLLLGAFAIWRILLALLSQSGTNRESLAGALFGYFLLVVIWAFIYQAMHIWSGDAFGLEIAGNTFNQLLYFSLVTITTLGYGDISPVGDFARISAGLEAATGTFYIAILVARIVGTLGAKTD